MHENPLLPHRKLRELHTLMLHTHALEQKQARKNPRLKKSTSGALLAATTMQLLPGDILLPAPNDLTAAQLAPSSKNSTPKNITTGLLTPITADRLAQAAAAAKALQSAATDNLVLAFARANTTEPSWLPALESAHAAQLPLILACADATGGLAPRSKPTANTLTYTALTRLSKRIKLPILIVDGEDAVAVYRVMQESVLRARLAGGPAVIWAVLSPPATTPKRSSQPIARLEHYLTTRKIPFTA